MGKRQEGRKARAGGVRVALPTSGPAKLAWKEG